MTEQETRQREKALIRDVRQHAKDGKLITPIAVLQICDAYSRLFTKLYGEHFDGESRE